MTSGVEREPGEITRSVRPHLSKRSMRPRTPLDWFEAAGRLRKMKPGFCEDRCSLEMNLVQFPLWIGSGNTTSTRDEFQLSTPLLNGSKPDHKCAGRV